ncbi:MAG: sugar phosphate isomerase/epimerase [Lachnospiraceae bacterium]|nr:sugar phosphate isomerase/epimerase [Lachnospiraceae bacterium]
MKIAAFYENMLTAMERENLSFEEILTGLKNCGLELIYISGDSYKKDWNEIEPVLKKHGIGIEGMHQHFDFGHDGNCRDYEEYIDIAKKIGASNILLVPGFIPEDETDKEKEIRNNMLSCMKAAVEYGKNRGVAVCMEDFDNLHSPICSVAGMDFFFDAIPDLKCAFDTGNFVCYTENEMDAFKHFSDRIVTMHVKDRGHEKHEADDYPCECFDGSKAWSVPVGTGYIRIKEIVEYLKKNNYQGNLIAELYGYADAFEGLKTSVTYLKKLLKF